MGWLPPPELGAMIFVFIPRLDAAD